MRLILLIAAGGAVWTVARFLLGGLVQPAHSSYPWGTLVVNVLGAFTLGFLMRFLLGTGQVPPEWRAALTIGLCGGFTTMSTFAYETVALLGDGDYRRAAAYVVASTLGSVAAVFTGLASAERLL